MAALEEQPMKRMQVDECSVQLTLYVAEPYVGDRRSKVDELLRRAAAARRPLTGGHRRTVQRRKESVAPSTRRPLSLIHISEPTRLLSISYAVFCLKKKK